MSPIVKDIGARVFEYALALKDFFKPVSGDCKKDQ